MISIIDTLVRFFIKTKQFLKKYTELQNGSNCQQIFVVFDESNIALIMNIYFISDFTFRQDEKIDLITDSFKMLSSKRSKGDRIIVDQLRGKQFHRI